MSQSTVSRAVTGLTDVLGRVVVDYVPVAEAVDSRTQCIVDETLRPCWSWHGQRELYSGKHKATGMNVQVAGDLNGRVAWISDPVDGCRHDTAALALSGAIDTLDPSNWMGDKGYVGNDMVTPLKEPAHRSLLDWEKELSTDVEQDPLPNRTNHSEPETLANPPHRLPATTLDIHHNHLNRIAPHFYAIT